MRPLLTSLRYPLKTITFLLWRMSRRKAHAQTKIHNLQRPSYALDVAAVLGDCVVPIRPLEVDNAQVWLGLSEHFRAHRFDVLGSGWTHIASPSQHLEARINISNITESKKIALLMTPDYQMIDWQLDLKSKYRWREDLWSTDVPITPIKGTDIKVPWELSRCHHLTHLAFAYSVDGQIHHAREFRDQVLDFIAQNPPRFGVNWRCPMDVAIRAVNWIVAYDIFINQGVPFDGEFNSLFARSLYEHGLFIWEHLEWHPLIRGNHYLANLTGLIFIARRLQPRRDTKQWLKFARRELLTECERQFLPDGANFESSTSYHRLSAEMVVFSIAALKGEKMPAAIFKKIEKMAEFTMHVTKANGRIAQIGDNDSGRLLKLEPEADLDHRPLISLINGFFGRADFDAAAAGSLGFGRQWLDHYYKNQRIKSYRDLERSKSFARVMNTDPLVTAKSIDQGSKLTVSVPWPTPVSLSEVQHYAYPDFGLYLFRGKSFNLMVRCGSTRWDFSGGHAHNDQLAVELEVEGEDWILDPGTYLYTSDPDMRNLYRSTKAHFTPMVIGQEQADLTGGLFELSRDVNAQCLHFHEGLFLGRHYAHPLPVYRLVQISPEGLCIQDWTEGMQKLEWPPHHLSGGRLKVEALPFSPGYGKRA